MADTVKPIRIEGVALLAYQRSKGLISKHARKPHSMTRKRKNDEKQMEGGDSTESSNSPPGPQLNYRQINVSRTGAAASPLTSTKIGGSFAPPKGGSSDPPKGGAETPEKSEKPKMYETPAKNGSGIKHSNSPLPKQPTFLSPVKGGAVPVVTTPGHIPNTPSTSPLPPAMEAAKEAGTLPPQGGGKVELAPKKKGTRHGIVLAPPRESKKRHIRGHTRKIRVQLSNMKRRMQTAKVIHKQSSDKPIEEVRKLLEDAKLIRSGKSSVPESLLRNMYRDYLVLRSKAL